LIIVDTGVLYAYFDAPDQAHHECAELLQAERDGIVVSPYVLAELDHFIGKHFGGAYQVRVLEELTGGGFELPVLTPADVIACSEVMARYPDQRIGLTDASLVVLAERYETRRIGTYDRRHFSVIRPMNGGWFELLPQG
jgi:predicted nucleic acid-binding protein